MQAGLLLWQILGPSDKKAKAKREDAIKGELIEVSVKNLAQTDDAAAVGAAGLLVMLCQTPTARETLLAARPLLLPSVQKALSSKSTSLVAATCSLLKLLSSAPETRNKVLLAFRDWDWKPLLVACTMLV